MTEDANASRKDVHEKTTQENDQKTTILSFRLTLDKRIDLAIMGEKSHGFLINRQKIFVSSNES